LCAAWLCTTIAAGGTLVVRYPASGPATAIRVTEAASIVAVPALSSSTGAVRETATRSRADGQLPARPITPVTGPPTTSAASRPTTTVPPTSTTTSVAGPTTTGPPSTPPSTTPLTPLTTLLQRIVPVAAAVLGQASWFDAPVGTCAHRDLPLGTMVKVTRTASGVSTTCRVADRGPTLATNRVIDLSLDTFEKLASSDAGVIEVRLEW